MVCPIITGKICVRRARVRAPGRQRLRYPYSRPGDKFDRCEEEVGKKSSSTKRGHVSLRHEDTLVGDLEIIEHFLLSPLVKFSE